MAGRVATTFLLLAQFFPFHLWERPLQALKCLWSKSSLKMSQGTALKALDAALSRVNAVINATFLTATREQLRNP